MPAGRNLKLSALFKCANECKAKYDEKMYSNYKAE